jgi:hypothetical protein
MQKCSKKYVFVKHLLAIQQKKNIDLIITEHVLKFDEKSAFC